MLKLRPRDMHLADTVQLFNGAFGYGVVNQIKDGLVYVFRPFAATADFSYTGGVIPYVGIETVTYPIDSSVELPVLSRKDLR